MSVSAAGAAPAAGARLSPIVTVVPYVLLALLTGFTVAAEPHDGRALAVDLTLCALAALWTLWMFTLHPAWRARPRVTAWFIGVLVVLMAVLVVRHSWFGFYAIAGYAYAFTLLPWPRQLAATAAVAVVAGTAQVDGLPQATVLGIATYVTVLALNILATSAAAWAFWRSEGQKRQLEQTLTENESLQRRLVDQAREAGMLTERERMAREIHDTLAQGLTGIITQLHAAERSAGDPDAWRRHVGAATRLAKDSLTEARRSVHALRPEALEGARLGDALEDVAAKWATLHGVPVRVTVTGTVRPIAPHTEVALLRVAQEALANVAKHARAGRVGLTLSFLDAELALDVRDDGRGFDPGRPAAPAADDDASGGFGLPAMRERIAEAGGTLLVESAPGEGTTVSARIPLGSESDAAAGPAEPATTSALTTPAPGADHTPDDGDRDA